MSDAINQRIADLNWVGISLSSIGQQVDLHHSTIKFRLNGQGLQPTDTRRAFMEDVFNQLSLPEQTKLIAKSQTYPSIKEYIRDLIQHDLAN